MSDENAAAREELAKQIWAGDDEVIATNQDKLPVSESDPPQEPLEKSAPEKTEPQVNQEPDAWAGVPAALRTEFETLRAKVGQTDNLEARLKQAERRLGAVQGELHAAKETAKVISMAPTAEQIAASAQSAKDWEEVKENFPELAKATESRLAAEREEMRKLIPDQAVVKRQIDEGLDAYKEEVAGNFVALRHPDWVEVKDSKEFQAWNEAQGDRNSYNPLEVIAILDDYKKFKASQKTPKQIEAERQQRLEQSQSTEGRNVKPMKSEADMSPTELRAHLAKQVWTS